MKYQTEYQRNFQKRTPREIDDYTVEQRRVHEVPVRRTSSLSPARRRGRSAPSSPNRNNASLAVIGPNEKFSNSYLHRLRQPVNVPTRVTKPREYAILGRNEKFNDNVVYPLRKPLKDDSTNNQTRRHKHDNHSCGIQTELEKAPHVSFDPQYGRETIPVRSRIGAQSEYQQQFLWKQPLGDLVSDQMLVEDAKVRDRRSDPVLPLSVLDPSEKLLQHPPPPPPPPVHVDYVKEPVPRLVPSTQLKRDQISEYQARYKPIIDQKQPRTRKAFEAEQAEERKQKELERVQHAHSDDEGANANLNLERKPTHTNLKRWKSEYQMTYKPFWRFDYKNGKWYKDSTVEESGFNPNLFWYKELLSTRQRANQYRSNAEADHFNRNHTLQLQTGAGGNQSILAWDASNDDDTESVVSIDRNPQRERENRERKDFVERTQTKIHYQDKPTVPKSDQVAPTDHQVHRVIHLDEPVPKIPSLATKALVRNLNSSAVQEQMIWDSESVHSQPTSSDLNSHRQYPKKSQQTTHAAGRGNVDTHLADKRPATSFQNHVNHLNERFKSTYPQDDDVLSVHSARSLSSSCSLASQTLERAQQNMNKYWGNQSFSTSIDSSRK